MGCSLTCTWTYKSPGGPPLSPRSPSPAKRIRSPLSTPAGTFTDKVLASRTLPCPLQAEHGEVITVPVPRHLGQVCCTEKKPCCMRTCPWPPQVLQGSGLVSLAAPLPLHVSQATRVGTRIFTVAPRKIGRAHV